jgi:DNA repair exonuclease SbcCD nuclease subunit
MKILFISDLHFHAYKAHSEIVGGINSRLAEIASPVRAAFESNADICDLCVIAGDIFHVRGSIKPSVQNFVADLLSEMAMMIPILIVPGNHDMEDYKTGQTSVGMFDFIPDVSVVTAPQVLELDGQKIITIPYIHKVDEFKGVFEGLSAEADADTITVLHQGIDTYRPEGMPESGVTPSYLMKHNAGYTFSGHYHGPEVTKRIVNVGAVCQHSFGDVGITRGCFVFDTEAKEAKFTSLAQYCPQFVDLDEDVPEGCKGNFVRVRVKTKVDARRLNKFAMDNGAKDVTVIIEKEFKTAHERPISVSKPDEMLSEYIDTQERMRPFKPEILKLYAEVCDV